MTDLGLKLSESNFVLINNQSIKLSLTFIFKYIDSNPEFFQSLALLSDSFYLLYQVSK